VTAAAGEKLPDVTDMARGETGPFFPADRTPGETAALSIADSIPYEPGWPDPTAGLAGGPALPDRRVALTALVLVAAVLMADGYLEAGPAGFVVAATVLALLAILAARAMIPRGEEPPLAAAAENQRPAEGNQADFPAYREITSDLYWADASRRHYDHGLRPRLARLLDARLAQRYELDAEAQPERARDLVGAELWPLVDMSTPPSNDSHAPGVSLTTLARIVTRLEEL
jgi:hypothetical protein